jgi:hypothetical protein
VSGAGTLVTGSRVVTGVEAERLVGIDEFASRFR